MRNDCGGEAGGNRAAKKLRRGDGATAGSGTRRRSKVLLRVCGAALLAAALAAPAQAQQRTIADGTPGQILRRWPLSGVWLVLLGVAKDGGLSCVMATGHDDPVTGDTYLWGFRRKGQSFSLMVTDKNAAAVSAGNIKIVIDGSPAGTFAIGPRLVENGFHNVNAELPPPVAATLSRLVRIGGSVQFHTGTATYAAPLEGAAQAMGNLDACAHEVRELDAARQQPKN